MRLRVTVAASYVAINGKNTPAQLADLDHRTQYGWYCIARYRWSVCGGLSVGEDIAFALENQNDSTTKKCVKSAQATANMVDLNSILYHSPF